jgi:hypothetical protein
VEIRKDFNQNQYKCGRTDIGFDLSA